MVGATLLSVFLDGVARHPDRLAAADSLRALTYGDLAAEATRLSRALDSGDEPVAVIAAPSVAAVTGFLAALLSGRPYLPIDPAYPAERIRFMTEVAGCRHLLIDDGGPQLLRHAAQHATSSAAPADDLAYVIFTSGSTGRPKGVRIPHPAILNLLAEVDRVAPVPDPFIQGWWCSPGFDVAVWEVWAALCYGGTVRAFDDVPRWDGEAYSRGLAAHRIDSAYVPPAFLGQLASGGDLALRRLLVGVEPIRAGVLAAIMARIPGLCVINGYGPAEATVCSTLYRVPPHATDPDRRVPLGTGIHGAELAVFDGDRRLSEDGVGELYIAGTGLGRGYLDPRDEVGAFLTALPDGTEGRWYRTGDRVRILAEGLLEYVGRVDDQIKLRGYRVEPGEVESAVVRAGFAEAASAVVVGAGDARRLVCALVPTPTCPADHEIIRRLLTVLPQHAVPQQFVRLTAMPMTEHGKVDRRGLVYAIGEMDMTAPDLQADNPAATAWCRALGRPEAPTGVSFLELGGTSLDAARVAGALTKAYDAAVTITDVVAAADADSLDRRLRAAEPSVAAEMDVADTEGPVQLPRGLVSMLQMEVSRPGVFDEPLVMTFGPMDADIAERAVRDVVAAHPAVFSRTAGPLVRATIEPAEPPRDWLRRLEYAEHHPDYEAIVADPPRLAAARGDTCRAVLLVRDGLATGVVFFVHHLIFDGGSTAIFQRDLGRALRGEAVPRGPVGFVDCLRRRGTPDSGLIAARAGELVVALGPGDGEQTIALDTTPTGASVRIDLLGLDGAAAAAATTPFCLIVAGWISAGVPSGLVPVAPLPMAVVADSRTPQESDVVGCFVRELPLVLPTPAAETDILREVTRAIMATIAHPDVTLTDIAPWLYRAGRSPHDFVRLTATYESWQPDPTVGRLEVGDRDGFLPKAPVALSCVRRGAHTYVLARYDASTVRPDLVRATADALPENIIRLTRRR